MQKSVCTEYRWCFPPGTRDFLGDLIKSDRYLQGPAAAQLLLSLSTLYSVHHLASWVVTVTANLPVDSLPHSHSPWVGGEGKLLGSIRPFERIQKCCVCVRCHCVWSAPTGQFPDQGERGHIYSVFALLFGSIVLSDLQSS